MVTEEVNGMKWKTTVAASVLAAAVAAAGCGGEKKLSQTELIEQSKPTLVRIQGKEGGGSGVVIDAQKGLVLTNAHVAVGLAGMKARVGDVASSETAARLVAAAPCEDLAVVQLVNKPPNLKAMTIGASANVKAGEHVTVLGYPGSFQEQKAGENIQQAQNLVATDGTISSANITATPDASLPKFASVIQHSASTNPGNSGGPLVNDKGELIGINTLRNPETQGQFYSISVDRVKTLLPQLKAGRSQALVGWDLLPIEQVDLPTIFANDPDYGSQGGAALGQRLQTALRGAKGMYVTNVQTGSPAKEASPSIDPGDLITSIEGEPVASTQDVCDIVTAKSPGEKVAVRAVQINSGTKLSTIGNRFATNVTLK